MASSPNLLYNILRTILGGNACSLGCQLKTKVPQNVGFDLAS